MKRLLQNELGKVKEQEKKLKNKNALQGIPKYVCFCKT